MWLLFGSVLIASLIIGMMSITLTASVIQKSSTENMNLLCKSNADDMDISLAKIEDSVDTLAHYAEAELIDVKLLQNDEMRAAFSASLEKSALHHIESAEGAEAVWMHYDEAYIGKTDGFFYVKKQGTQTFESHPLTVISAYNKDDTEHVGWWYTTVENGRATWLEAYYNANMQRHIISYAVPIYKEGLLVGVIGADISTDYVEDLAKKMSIYNSGKAAVLKSDGTVVYHPNFAKGHLIGEGDPGFAGVVDALTASDHTDELIAYELDGVEKRLASYKLRNGMLMVCFAPVSEIYREQRELILFTGSIILVVIAGALLIAFFVSREMARPIKQLNEAAKHLTDGEFDYDINTKSRDEIGELTSTFIETRKILKNQIHLLDAEAHRDGLTGVGNKSAFMDREAVINDEIFAGTADFSVAVFDVNKLKITNDVFGHMAGDKLLWTVSNFLMSCFGLPNVYRMGGDEFVVILDEKDDEDRTRRISDCIDGMQDLWLEDFPECRVSCAYGVAHFDAETDHRLADVLRRADKEMYNNKSLTKRETFPWQEGMKGIKQLQVEKYCQLLQTLTSSTDDYLFLMNTETGVIRFFGDDPNAFDIADGRELAGGILDMLRFVHVNDHALVKNAVTAVIQHDTETIDINFRMNINNSARWVNCRGSVIKDETDSHFVVIGRISQNAVKHLYNPITTLFNKTKLKADLLKQTENSFSCLMLLDIDNLSEINLKHGSVYGDKLLKMLAEELENRFSLQQLYHAEKDRFVVLLNVESSREAEARFEEIKAAMEGQCTISASVVPNDRSLYVSAENIYDYAVQILNSAKKDGVGKLVFFSKDSLMERLSAVELLEELEDSVKHKCRGFSLMYQPQIAAEDLSLVSAEALLRFESKTKGLVYPDQFIPLLEQAGLINEVGAWVVNEALGQCKAWRERFPEFKISVNVSPKQLEKKRFAAQITRLLTKHGLPGEALILEITESTPLDESEDTFAILAKLRQAGVQIAIDDFGTGYSNLGNLKHIHANILKVDRVFIRGIKENGYNYNLIYNVIEFARSNELKVCLEGVETTDEFAVVSGLQPDIFQGYLFDKPMTVELLEAKYLSENTKEYAERLELTERLNKVKRHAPVVNMEMKTILSGIRIGLWIVRIDKATGKGELYTDETMRALLDVDDAITPKDCFAYWLKRIHRSDRAAVEAMIDAMTNSDKVVQVEYRWHHPKKDTVTVRCSGRCMEKDEHKLVFEGFHRVISDVEDKD
ncbi:MAG: EAL domain-containing protein [Clostridia bacterium]|nr:EAL domain-containing protein [Clostridia bacterium]